MPDVTHLLDAAAVGDRMAAADLLPLVDDELQLEIWAGLAPRVSGIIIPNP
jgi:hypothetical protein